MLLEAGLKNYSNSDNDSFWPSSILGDTLRIVFQNLLLESNVEILQCSERVWRILLQVFLHISLSFSRDNLMLLKLIISIICYFFHASLQFMIWKLLQKLICHPGFSWQQPLMDLLLMLQKCFVLLSSLEKVKFVLLLR